MPNEQLITFIRSELTRGANRETVIRSLLSVGWKVEDINVALATIDGNSISVSSPIPLPVSPVPEQIKTKDTSKIGSFKTIPEFLLGICIVLVVFWLARRYLFFFGPVVILVILCIVFVASCTPIKQRKPLLGGLWVGTILTFAMYCVMIFGVIYSGSL